MSSKNAIYESSTLAGFGAVDELVVATGFGTGGATIGRLEGKAVDDDVFGLGLGSAVSLLTRTDAGTCHKRRNHFRPESTYWDQNNFS